MTAFFYTLGRHTWGRLHVVCNTRRMNWNISLLQSKIFLYGAHGLKDHSKTLDLVGSTIIITKQNLCTIIGLGEGCCNKMSLQWKSPHPYSNLQKASIFCQKKWTKTVNKWNLERILRQGQMTNTIGIFLEVEYWNAWYSLQFRVESSYIFYGNSYLFSFLLDQSSQWCCISSATIFCWKKLFWLSVLKHKQTDYFLLGWLEVMSWPDTSHCTIKHNI